MADWYVSSAAYALIPQWQASTAYTVGQIVRPLTAPAFNVALTFRCTTAGTSGSTEPGFGSYYGNNNALSDGTVTWTNISGQAAYGWGGCAQTLFSITYQGNSYRLALGDRVFLSSDHTESATNAQYSTVYAGGGFGSCPVISVNRGGSVPPVSADAQSGAALNYTGSGSFLLDPLCEEYFQGITFGIGGSSSGLWFANGGTRSHYFKNCAFVFTTTNINAQFGDNNPSVNVFDNTTVTFNNSNQRFAISIGYGNDFTWINTPSAVQGSIPATLFAHPSNQCTSAITCRGLDLSAVNTTLFTGGGGSTAKVLFDSCRISSGVVRLGATYNTPGDEVELVNCYDGTRFLAERHTPGGDLTTEFATTMIGGAADNVGLFSHKLVSSSRSDKYGMTFNSFWMDVNLTTLGTARTATVEIVSSGTLNTDDIALMLEYEGIASSSLASFATSFPAIVPTTPVAHPTSSQAWNSPPSTPVYQHLQVTFTPQTAGRVRGLVRLGKPSTTVWINPQLIIT